MNGAYAGLREYLRVLLFPPRTDGALRRRQEKLRERLWRRLPEFPFYRALAARTWAELPVVTKTLMLANFSGFNREHVELADAMALARENESRKNFARPLGHLSVGLSSGTSGKRSVFLVNRREIGAWAGAILGKALGWGIFRRQRIAFVFRANNPLYQSLQLGWLRFRYLDINADPVLVLAALAEFQPTILVSTPLFLLRHFALEPKRRISPRMIFSVADVLLPEEKRKVEAHFACPVREIYQASEGFLAISCRLGRLHLNEDLYLFEREPIDGRRWMPILTDLRRESQAYVRYRLDDILVDADAPCPCGSPLAALDRVEGRRDHVLTFRTAGGGEAQLFPDLFREIMGTDLWHETHYRIVQAPGNVLKVFTDKLLISSEEEAMRSRFEAALAARGVKLAGFELGRILDQDRQWIKKDRIGVEAAPCATKS